MYIIPATHEFLIVKSPVHSRKRLPKPQSLYTVEEKKKIAPVIHRGRYSRTISSPRPPIEDTPILTKKRTCTSQAARSSLGLKICVDIVSSSAHSHLTSRCATRMAVWRACIVGVSVSVSVRRRLSHSLWCGVSLSG